MIKAYAHCLRKPLPFYRAKRILSFYQRFRAYQTICSAFTFSCKKTDAEDENFSTDSVVR